MEKEKIGQHQLENSQEEKRGKNIGRMDRPQHLVCVDDSKEAKRAGGGGRMGGAPSKILPALYLGGASALGGDFLRTTGITHVLSLCRDSTPGPAAKEALTGHLHVPINDSLDADMRPHFAPCLKFIHEARKQGGRCYVHCMVGISRSTTIVCAYLMVHLDMDFVDALQHITRCRRQVCPNPSFQKQLKELQGSGEAAKLAFELLRGTPPSAATALREADRAAVERVAAGGGVEDGDDDAEAADEGLLPDLGLDWVHVDPHTPSDPLETGCAS